MTTYLTPDEKLRLHKHLALVAEGTQQAGQCIDGDNPEALLQTIADTIKDLKTLREIAWDIAEADIP